MRTDYPSLPEQGKNLAQFTIEVVKSTVLGGTGGHRFVVSDVEYESRLSICSTCEYYDEKQVRCKHCGCWLKTKAKFKQGTCPIHRW